MRKLYLNGKEYELKTGDIMTIYFEAVILLSFSAFTERGHERLKLEPDGDDKIMLNAHKVSSRELARFVCNLIGFEHAEERDRKKHVAVYRLHK
jgi:hypothetical protein